MKRVAGSPDRSWALFGGLAWGRKADVTFTTRNTPESVSKREVLGFLGREKPVEGLRRANRNIYNSICCCVFITDSCRARGITISLFNIEVY